MRSEEITTIRLSLGLTQTQLGHLLDVHEQTVSKWERGVLDLSPHKAALLQVFRDAAKKQPGVGKKAAEILLASGSVRALFHLIRVAFEE